MLMNWLAVEEQTWWNWSPCALESVVGDSGRRLRHRECSKGLRERIADGVDSRMSWRSVGRFGAVDVPRRCFRCCDGVAVYWPGVDR